MYTCRGVADGGLAGPFQTARISRRVRAGIAHDERVRQLGAITAKTALRTPTTLRIPTAIEPTTPLIFPKPTENGTVSVTTNKSTDGPLIAQPPPVREAPTEIVFGAPTEPAGGNVAVPGPTEPPAEMVEAGAATFDLQKNLLPIGLAISALFLIQELMNPQKRKKREYARGIQRW